MKHVDRGRTPAIARAAAAPALLLCLAAAAGCGDDDPTAPDERAVPGERLTFIHPSDTAPPLLTTDTSVVATRGQSLDVEFFYEDPQEPGQRGERFLRFRLEDGSLLRYPEDHPMAGAAFEPGDTVTLRIRVARDTLLADFGPDGLQFDPDRPAELKIDYIGADRDTDDDGEDDPDFEEDIDLWRQEQPGEPWFRAGVIKDFEGDELEADLTSFTIYAVAI